MCLFYFNMRYIFRFKVRKEYLTDFKSGHGEFTPGVWVSVKSMPGKQLSTKYHKSMLPYMISYLSVHSSVALRHLLLIWIYLTYSSGIVWTMG